MGEPQLYTQFDLFEHIWTVDRLERLGISRYFQEEIKECVNYVNRASQVMFPEEQILKGAKQFSATFFTEKRAANKLFDKWIITKDLPGEVGFALDVPWYASLPRLEARFYIEQYGGGDDVWIGKTLYRMHLVNNDVYLELAKMDYNNYQALHRSEWDNIQMWYSEAKLENYGLSIEELQFAYYLAAACIFEPERSLERFAWAKNSALIHTIHDIF
ncbi:Copalyl diphosphate synthase [Quillaja saponaria]|uniref:Copalyl diphosphate synthase n=1 Tax=Quillaja saponaria TaxID=32244 RepID=A0AAD7Q9V5_QUISA|nr:Copalyl diphosphate synthase [Quillaja saponaria]